MKRWPRSLCESLFAITTTLSEDPRLQNGSPVRILKSFESQGEWNETLDLFMRTRVVFCCRFICSLGHEWIILPNPDYGSSERAFFDPATEWRCDFKEKSYRPRGTT
jgi:hypothetical protein